MTKLDERIKELHEACDLIFETAVDLIGSDKESTKEQIAAITGSALFIGSSLAVSLAEISHSVGILAILAQRDYEGDVDNEAEKKAADMHQETVRRSFIGKKPN